MEKNFYWFFPLCRFISTVSSSSFHSSMPKVPLPVAGVLATPLTYHGYILLNSRLSALAVLRIKTSPGIENASAVLSAMLR